MKKFVVFFCIAFLGPQLGAMAHQEKHVHSQWIQQQLNQLNRTIQQLRARVDKLENAGAGGPQNNAGAGGQQTPTTGNKNYLSEKCSAGEQKLCQKGCPTGWKTDTAICVGKGSIGKTHHENGLVSCYCFSRDDPNCQVESITATCIRP